LIDLLKQRQTERRIGQTEVIERPGIRGTFSPILLGGTVAGTFTYTLQNGRWLRVGGGVFVSIHVAISVITVAPTGNMMIGNLPFTADTPDPGTLDVSDQTGFTLGANYFQVGVRVSASATTGLIIKSGTNIGALVLQGAAFALVGGAAEFVCSGWYLIP
jgi:hypothetical protein